MHYITDLLSASTNLARPWLVFFLICKPLDLLAAVLNRTSRPEGMPKMRVKICTRGPIVQYVASTVGCDDMNGSLERANPC